MGKIIAYCGLDCGKCDAYLATLNNDEVLREKTAKAWAELNNVPIQPKDYCAIIGLNQKDLENQGILA